jgi:hypothetical protein
MVEIRGAQHALNRARNREEFPAATGLHILPKRRTGDEAGNIGAVLAGGS